MTYSNENSAGAREYEAAHQDWKPGELDATLSIAFARQLKAIDSNDVGYFCDEFSEEICNAFQSGDKLQIGEIFYKGLRALAQARANFEVFGTSKQSEPIPQMRGTLADLGKLTIRVEA